MSLHPTISHGAHEAFILPFQPTVSCGAHATFYFKLSSSSIYLMNQPTLTNIRFAPKGKGGKKNMVSEKRQPKHVCVIGAGPAGLVSARELRKEGHSVVVLEQKHDIGGQWLYDPIVEIEDALGRITPLKVHSSMYASLRLMSPREVMGFTDFPFFTKKGRDMRRFPGHREVYLYLRDFCQWFELRELIKFNTRVEYVGMVYNIEFGSDMKWVVRSKEEKCETVNEEIFDAVVVASGHYSQPTMPTIKGKFFLSFMGYYLI